jgi:hypothetical protein
LIGEQWKRERKLIGVSFKLRSYYEHVLRKTIAVSKELVSSISSSIKCHGNGDSTSSYEMLFLPASIQISVGSDEILLQMGIFNINTLLGLGLGIGLVHLLVYGSVYT